MSEDPRSVWKTELLRGTLFPKENFPILENSWWRFITGTEPDSRILQPRIPRLTESGKLLGSEALLALDCQRGRIDWILRPIPPRDPPDDLPAIGPFPEALALFQRLLLPWLPQSPKAARLAFGATLFHTVQDVPSGNRFLAPFLPCVKIDVETITDFLYSVNRPRHSQSVSGLCVNRLARWANLEVALGIPTLIGHFPVCRLELDVNTAQQPSVEIPVQRCENLFRELLSLGEEIAEKGDQP
ncbi:hypothetical protein [Verrucomicrobium sp. 3C]|uniref:hypothetical protein n=1 Tax=Verrucomicrobium sp. 3C TaxID=1134055 RepID=UPI00036E3556|nr:hypothetical protein [Verrucomicrobium sp. 3C]